MADLLITSIFILGYLAIILEHRIHVNKAASALITGTLCWTVFILFREDKDSVFNSIAGHMGDISGILFFLLGAMTIVELIDMHDGFEFIAEKLTTGNKRLLLWILGLFTFFLSALLDNLTTTIVMVSLSRKFLQEEKDRWLFAGIIIIAANAGGAWSPMGDVTTTMLWIGQQITAYNIIVRLFVPSLVCLLVPLVMVTFLLRRTEKLQRTGHETGESRIKRTERNIIFLSGILMLVLVPVFKSATHLPPYIGMLLSLGIMWVIAEVIHRGKRQEEKGALSVARALERLDSTTILFFLGILLCVSALESSEILHGWAQFLTEKIGNQTTILMVLGLVSAVVDNVPLVGAVQGMYPLTVYPTDHYFWEFLAYVTGTGGSILVIGSAAGVAAMGMERITFIWYLKRISLLALIGYLSGFLILTLM